MIFIVVKFETKPEWTERWPELVAPFTEATRAEGDHFKAAQRDLPQALASTPKVISQTIDATGWSELAEITVD